MARQAFVGERTWENEVLRENGMPVSFSFVSNPPLLCHSNAQSQKVRSFEMTRICLRGKEKKRGNKESENGMTALPRDLVHFIFPFLSPKNACRLETSAV